MLLNKKILKNIFIPTCSFSLLVRHPPGGFGLINSPSSLSLFLSLLFTIFGPCMMDNFT